MTPAARQVFERGYLVLEGLYDEAERASLRRTLDELTEAVGEPKMWSKQPERPFDGMEISTTGLVFYELLGWRPDVAPTLLKPEAVSVVREVLGDDAHVELVGGVVTDETRPFYEWHNHIGGIDDEAIRHGGGAPARFPSPQRITHIVYLDGLSEDTGPLLVYPRAATDPTAPPHPIAQERWEGAVRVTCPPGSVVLLEQCTWHAAAPRATPGRRHFVGCHFASADAPPTDLVDASLARLEDPPPLLRGLLRARSAR
ncbi:MAG TPA: phytanoyl-CoA dioxygenase family protein [Sandaracinaceae bacterium LLY-WYZ-13_1]|nr:phytanoyl-CoA dioxygenase family protein [Sandaracinaceae bacterium LLY-WYZ-13_1]